MKVARQSSALLLALVTVCGSATSAHAQQDPTPQPAPLASREVAFGAIDSGLLANNGPIGSGPAIVFSTVVAADDSTWLRLEFDEVKLAGSRDAGNASYIRITSLTDGYDQILDNVSILQWKLTSAYFNGDAVQIDLVAHPGTGDNQLRLSHGVASEPAAADRSICGTTDDRVLSFDDRSARILPIGCTGWTIDDCNHCMLTAGHCQGGISTIQFRVPLSTSGGGLVNPHPDHQYATDTSSLQGNGGGGVGNDWAYYGVHPNSNTGLTPYQAYGVAFNLDTTPPGAGGSARVTGFGTTSSPVSNTWNQVQKTHAGPYVSFSGTTLGYAMDTTGGNSGSPVIHESSGTAIGIHTHGGCSSGGGNNWGTGANHAGLVAALASPKGVCECPGPEFTFPDPLPEFVAPSGGTTIAMDISTVAGVNPVSGSGVLRLDTGSGFASVPMTDDGTGHFTATFPAIDCTTPVTYYFTVLGSNGTTYVAPNGAPASTFSAMSAYGVASVVDLDFETDDGWTVVNTAVIRGAWERGTPIGGGLNRDPASDFDGSGRCWVTGNAAGDADVDGGPTRLVSPAYDLSGLSDPKITFARWHSTSGLPQDQFVTEISNNNGSTWTPVSSVGNNGNQWKVESFSVSDYVTPTNAVRVRFSVSDNPDNSVTESAIDAFSISDFLCSTCASDVNGDGESDVLDFLDFLDAFGACEGQPAPCSGSTGVNADFNGDTIVDVLDFLDFLDVFGQGCP